MSLSPARALTLFVFRTENMAYNGETTTYCERSNLMKKFAIAVLVLVLALTLAGYGKSRSDKIWEKITESAGEGEITTTVMDDGSVIQSYTLYESFR